LPADEAYFGKLTPPTENILRIANGAEPRSLDPHRSAGVPEGKIFKNTCEGLAEYDPRTLAPLPALALDWQTGDGAKSWVFRLRRDGRFSDGQKITAHDFVYSWRRIIDPNTASPYASLLYYVKNGQAIAEGRFRLAAAQGFVPDPKDPTHPLALGEDDLKDPAVAKLAAGRARVPYTPADLGITALDDYTVRVEMEGPTAFFPKMTPHYAFCVVPRQAIEKWGDRWSEPAHTVASGAFRVVEYTPYSQVVLAPNPHYWDRARVKLDRVYLLPVQETAQNANLYRAGEVDVITSGNLPPTLVRELRRYRDYQTGTWFNTYYYDLNVRRKPFTDLRVRRALNLAVDKRAIAEKFLGRGEQPATTFVPPGVAGYVPPAGPGYDPAAARRLLAEAGFPGGRGFPKITLYYNTQEAHRTVAEAVQRMWKQELGITVELQNEEWQTFQARRERRDYDIARDAWIGDYVDPSTFLALMAEDTLNNHPGWVDPRYSELLKRANAEADDTKRNALLREAEAYMLDQMPIVPVYFYSLFYLKKPWVDGWYPNLLDEHPFKFVRIDRSWRSPTVARTP